MAGTAGTGRSSDREERPLTDPSRDADSQGHGWWPYLLPYVAFLLAVEIGRRVPEAGQPLMLVMKPAVPALLLWIYWRRGAYPELRGYRLDAGVLADVAVGLASAALWMAPFLYFPAVREALGVDPSSGFDPTLLGESRVGLALVLRGVGYALVTPFFEELFIRSFVMRYADVYPGPGDFRRQPIARYTPRGFWTSVVVFTIGHLSWEWPVALAWVALTNLWFYRRRHLGSVIVVHGVANASILAFVALLGDPWIDPQGRPLPLWFFV